jgi:plasmid maintenance system antidote protein VapI
MYAVQLERSSTPVSNIVQAKAGQARKAHASILARSIDTEGESFFSLQKRIAIDVPIDENYSIEATRIVPNWMDASRFSPRLVETY